jgi:MSHA biogenesis protein MshQ
VCITQLPSFLCRESLAGDCSAVFPSVLQNYTPSGNIIFGWDGQALNDPDNALETANSIAFSPYGNDTCGAVDCIPTMSPSTQMNLEAFKISAGTTDISIGWMGNFVLGGDGNDSYEYIRSTKGQAKIRDNGAFGAYYINRLQLDWNDELILQAGTDYWISNLILTSSSHKITVEGSGTARVFIQNDVTVRWDDAINSSGPASKLLIVAYKNVSHMAGPTASKYLLYSKGDVTIGDKSNITGAIAAAGNIELESSDATIRYDASAPAAVQHGGLCGDIVELQCFNDDFNRSSLGSDWAVSNSGGSFGNPRIASGKLRLTNSSSNVATAASLLRLFPGAGNKIIYEFDHYAYSGNGADGIAVALSDASITPTPGGYGGSLGYAQRCGISGFAGGWLGLGIDEYGNFRNDGECRGDGGQPSGLVQDSVSVRGSGAGQTGYLLHGESGKLNPPVDNAGSSTPEYGHRYRITINHSDDVHAYVTVERDTGSGFQTLIATYDALSRSGQAAVPLSWLISMTGSTGGSRNIHEIDNLQVCATSMLPYNSIDHYRFYHDGSALTCSPENIQVRACLDADCTVEFAGNVDATLSPSGWVDSNSQTFLSGDTLKLWYTKAETQTLDISGDRSEFIAVNAPRCFIGATEQADCSLTFHDSGFIFDVPDHTADVSQSITVAAVRTDLTTQQCVPGFQSVTRDVSFRSEYLNPDSGTLSVKIKDTEISTSSTGTPLSLEFDNNGKVTIDVVYADVGQLNLNASYTGSADNDDAGLIMTGTDSFIARPDHFNITVPGNPGAADASGGIFTVAGKLFQVEVSARNAGNTVTPNYGLEAPAESVKLSRSLVAPAGQKNPVLLGGFDSFGTDCSGDTTASGYACGQFSWEEVGIINLNPAVSDGNYLGTGDVIGNSSGNVGRFIPDRFAIAVNDPQLGHGCPSGSFTYLGQEFGYLANPTVTVTALGSTGATLSNYGDSFWKYEGKMDNRAYSHAGPPEAVTLNLSTDGTANLTGNLDYDGTGTVEITGDRLTYDKPTDPLPPFDTSADLDFTVNDLKDSDEVCYDSDNNGTCEGFTIGAIGDSEQRYGQMQLQNAYGPETLPLTIPVFTEFFDGTAFMLNVSDNCTMYNSSNIVLDNFQPDLNLNDGETSASGGGTLVSGLGTLILAAPGDDNDGSADVTLNLSLAPGAQMQWLQPGGINPAAKATFGIFRGNQRLIYMRESIW